MWLNKDDPQFYKFITGLRVGYELYNRVSAERDIEMYQVSSLILRSSNMLLYLSDFDIWCFLCHFAGLFYKYDKTLFSNLIP